VVVSGFSICAKGYCWSCSLSTLHICNLRASRHNLLSYPQNGIVTKGVRPLLQYPCCKTYPNLVIKIRLQLTEKIMAEKAQNKPKIDKKWSKTFCRGYHASLSIISSTGMYNAPLCTPPPSTSVVIGYALGVVNLQRI
jgi:hypothetical protein